MTTSTATPAGQVFHMLSDDGLALTSVYDGPEGVATVLIGWKDVDTAQENYDNAMTGFESRIPELLDKIDREQNSKQRLRRVGRFNVLINTGPPVWLLPKVRLRDTQGRREFAIGWIYGVIHVFPKDRKHEAAASA